MGTWFHSVVIDSHDPLALARFWSAALGWPITYEAPDEVVVGPQAQDAPALVFVPVADPKTVPNRVHLDLASASTAEQAATVERLVALGAGRADVGQGPDVSWVVLADPEGNEFCVLAPQHRYTGTGAVAAVVVHAQDPAALAPFWAAALGWPVVRGDERLVAMRHPRGTGPYVELVAGAGPKVVKDRLHLDVAPRSNDDQAAEVDRLQALGARPADVGQAGDESWVVLADPEGNELCVLSPRD